MPCKRPGAGGLDRQSCLLHGQLPHPDAGRGVDRTRERRGQRRQARLAESAKRGSRAEEGRGHARRIGQVGHWVVAEVLLHYAALRDGDLAQERRRQREDDAALDLRGGKGLNLAVADVWRLARALDARYRRGDETGLNEYSTRGVRRAWWAQRFSYWMTTLLHLGDEASAFDRRRQIAVLEYLVSSRAALASFAESYSGLPLD